MPVLISHYGPLPWREMFLHNVWVCLFNPKMDGKREGDGREMYEEGSKADQEKEEKRMRGNQIGGGRIMQRGMRQKENSEMCTAVKE